ncbi:MAG: hypothetical protein JW750_05380 [Anaerolineaceae bacterium]|nr:hypothetical protein [Anaerolineaceae bacterium]
MPGNKDLLGQITRGKTARNRLRRVDIFLLLYAESLIRAKKGLHKNALAVDLGYGAEPFTALEMAHRLRQINDQLPLLGIEIDPERVERSQPYANEITHFRLGGFNLPLEGDESVRLIRAFNVLRQYEEPDVFSAWKQMASYLLPGGLLIEGTSDPFGKVWVANLLRQDTIQSTSLRYEGLLFSTNFGWGFDPEMFQPVLPKNLIHRMNHGERIHTFMNDWKRACIETIAHKTWGLRHWFQASAERLSEMGYPILLRKRFLHKGFLLWQINEPLE